MQLKQSGKQAAPQTDAPKKWEFSKIMALIAVLMWLLVNFFGMVIVVFTLDTSPLMYVIPSVDAVVGIVLAAYYAKAKVENQIKLKKLYGIDVKYDDDEDEDDEDERDDSKSPKYENTNII